jgi:signal transduction histidine kinase
MLIFIVLLVVFSILCISSYQNEIDRVNNTLSMLLNDRQEQSKPPFHLGDSLQENLIGIPAFVFIVSDTGKIQLVSKTNVLISDNDLAIMSAVILASKNNDGVLRKYKLKYMKKTDVTGIKVAVVEISDMERNIRTAIILSICAFVISLLVFLIISIFLSNWFTRPIKQTWEQQTLFLSDASHELKTPLSVILANTEILKNNISSIDSSLWRWIDNTEIESKKMKKLVDDLLFLSKSDSSSSPIEHSRVSLSDIVLSAALSFESVGFEKNITIRTDKISESIYVNGSEFELSRLTQILLDNALKYSAEATSVEIELTTNQSKAVFSLSNACNSLPKEQLPRLFDRFYRGDSSHSGDGYGLGLSIAKSIIDRHGGKITVEMIGDNIRFTVVLPIS